MSDDLSVNLMPSRIKIIAVCLISIGLVLGLWIWSTANSFRTAETAVNDAWQLLNRQIELRYQIVTRLAYLIQAQNDINASQLALFTESKYRYAQLSSRKDKMTFVFQMERDMTTLLDMSKARQAKEATFGIPLLVQDLQGNKLRFDEAVRRYNTHVSYFNRSLTVTPKFIVAGLLNFEAYRLFLPADETGPDTP